MGNTDFDRLKKGKQGMKLDMNTDMKTGDMRGQPQETWAGDERRIAERRHQGSGNHAVRTAAPVAGQSNR